MLLIQAKSSDCPSFGCNEYFHFNELTHIGCLPTCSTLEHVSAFLKQSKIGLSSVIRSLKEPLFVGRKGRKKSGTDDCLVGNSCQDRKTSVGEGKGGGNRTTKTFSVVSGQARAQYYMNRF